MIATAAGFFSAQQCAHVIELSQRIQASGGRIDAAGDRSEMRNSDIRFLPPDGDNKWVFDKLRAALMQVNDAYGFDLQGFPEGVQVATYRPGGHYDWHIDLGTASMSTRKLSMSVQLSEAQDYEGGELEFLNSKIAIPREIGSLIVFPSFLAHRVRPVTRGARKSMVAWIHGTPFR